MSGRGGRAATGRGAKAQICGSDGRAKGQTISTTVSGATLAQAATSSNGETSPKTQLLQPKLEPGLSNSPISSVTINSVPSTSNGTLPNNAGVSAVTSTGVYLGTMGSLDRDRLHPSLKQHMCLPGVRPKKTFAPIIPKNQTSKASRPSNSRSDQDHSNRNYQKKKDNKPKRGPKELIETKGIWSEDAGAKLSSRSVRFGGGGGFRGRSRGGGGGGEGGGISVAGVVRADDGTMQQPVVSSSSITVDEAHEKQLLQEILEDEYDPEDENDTAEYYDDFCNPTYIDRRLSKNKLEASSKENEIDTTSETQITNGLATDEKPGPVGVTGQRRVPKTPAEMFTTPTNNFFFLQMSNTLPSIPSWDDFSQVAARNKQLQQTESSLHGEAEEETKKRSEHCGLSDLPCGQIGTIKVYKSGRVELCLMGQRQQPLILAAARPQDSVQKVVHVEIDEDDPKKGKVAVLGVIEHKLVVLPNFHTLSATKETSSTSKR